MTIYITATTTDDEIYEAIPYLDMCQEAIERRDDAAAVLEEQGNQTVLEYSQADGVDVLYSPDFGYALVNERTAGVGDSLLIGNGECTGPEQAARVWRGEK